MFWEEDSEAQRLFYLYSPALKALGVDFSNEDLQEILQESGYGLEDSFRSAIAYILWLEENQRQVRPTAILIDSLVNRWVTKHWRDEYLERPEFQSPGQRWWKAAIDKWGYDVRNQLVSDVYYDRGGREIIKFMNGREMLVDTAYRWGWERVLEFASPKELTVIN